MTARRRQSKGLPSGGEFAPRVRLDAEITLVAPRVNLIFAEDVRIAFSIELSALSSADTGDVSLDSVHVNAADDEWMNAETDGELALLDSVSSGSVSTTQAKLLLWNTLAPRWSVPPVNPQTLSLIRASQARLTVRAAGGVEAVCAEYLRTEHAGEGVVALMAPFGPSLPETTHSVCELLASRGDLAVPLWESAVRIASTSWESIPRTPRT